MSINIFAKEDDDAKQRNAALRARKEQRANERRKLGNKEQDVVAEPTKRCVFCSCSMSFTDVMISESERHRKAFTWENLNYTVPVPGGTRRLLHDVFGYVKPGTLTALMGASGAGMCLSMPPCSQPVHSISRQNHLS